MNPPEDMAQIVPYLYYEDAGPALEFMEKTTCTSRTSTSTMREPRRPAHTSGKNRILTSGATDSTR